MKPYPAADAAAHDLAVAIGARIQAERKARGWLQPDLCRRAKLNAETLSRIENGHGHGGGLRAYVRIARALRLDPRDLLSGRSS